LIYVFFAVGGFFAPALARRLGPRKGMVLGGLTYVLYVASLIYMITPLVLILSACIGCGAALLWTSQGMMMSQCTNETNKAKYFSMFWGIFNLCVIPGNIAGHFILSANHTDAGNHTKPPVDPLIHMVTGFVAPNSYLFMALTVAGAIGIALFLLLKDADSKYGTAPVIETRPVSQQVKATFMLTFSPRMVCLLPIFTFTGVAMTMWASWFTRQMASTEVGLVMPIFGVAEFIGGFTVGKFIDSFGRGPGIALASSFGLGAMALTYVANHNLVTWCDKHASSQALPCADYTDYGLFYVCAALFGFMDCTIQSVCGAICGGSFNSTGNAADAWALFRTFQAAGAAIGFFISTPLSIENGKTSSESQLLIEIVMTAGLLVISIMGHWLFSKYTILTEVKTSKAAAPVGGMYSQGVVVGGVLYTAGCIGLEAGLTPSQFNAGLSVEQQTAIALQNLVQVLKEAKCSINDVVKTTVFLADINDAAAMNSEYKKVFFGDGLKFPPARSMVAVAKLPLGAAMEIEAVAALPMS